MGELKQRLKEPNYRNVRERTRRKRVELETTHMCVEDLEKYWGALDKVASFYSVAAVFFFTSEYVFIQ